MTGKTDLFDEDVCQVWLLHLSETADYIRYFMSTQETKA